MRGFRSIGIYSFIISMMMLRVYTYIYQPVKNIPKDLSKLHYNPKHHSFYYALPQTNKQSILQTPQSISPLPIKASQSKPEDNFLEQINDYVNKKSKSSSATIVNEPLAQSYSTQTIEQYQIITTPQTNSYNKNTNENGKKNNSQQNYVQEKDNLLAETDNKVNENYNIIIGENNPDEFFNLANQLKKRFSSLVQK